MDADGARKLRGLLDEHGRTRDDELCAHLLAQIVRGRPVGNVLRDRFVRERTSPDERRRLARDEHALDELADEVTARALARRLRPAPAAWLPPAA